jgi:hypothetical protein
MNDDSPWSSDCEILANGIGGEAGEKLTELVNTAAAKAKAGNLTAAADSLESVRRMLVGRDYFRRYDNDLWVFDAIIRCIRHESPETQVPPSYQPFIDARPPLTMDQDMTREQKAFWYGSPGAQVGGEIRMVPRQENNAEQPPISKKSCFIATAAYGSDVAPEVEAFRSFRDRVLVRHPLGRRFIQWYYEVSPPLALRIKSRPFVQMAVRFFFLSPILFVLKVWGRAKRQTIRP